MIKSKLYKTISVLSENDISALKKWVSSNYFNENIEITKFFMCIAKIIPLKDAKKLTKESIFNKLFPTLPYDDAKMRKMMFSLLKIIESYIVFQSVSQTSVFDLHLMEFYRHKVSDEFLKKIPEFEKKWITDSIANMGYFENSVKFVQYKMNRFSYLYPTQKNENIIDLLRAQEILFTIQQLKWYFVIVVNMNVYHTPRIEEEITTFMARIENTDYLKSVSMIETLYLMVQLYIKEDDSLYFDLLRTNLLHKMEEFSHEEKSNFAAALRNHCMSKIRKGNMEYKMIRYELYKEHLEFGYLFSGKTLSIGIYRQVVIMGLELNKVEDTAAFIENFKGFLKEEDRNNNYYYCKGRLFWQKKDYRNVERMLKEIAMSEDIFLVLPVRRLKAMALFMEGEIELVLAQLNAFNVYLSRNKKLNPRTKKSNLNFIHFLNAICLLSGDEPQKKLSLMQKIKSELTEEKEWLIGLVSA